MLILHNETVDKSFFSIFLVQWITGTDKMWIILIIVLRISVVLRHASLVRACIDRSYWCAIAEATRTDVPKRLMIER